MSRNTRLILVSIVCLYFLYYIKTYTEWHFIDGVNLIFHEAGHTIFSFFGEFISIAAGSGFQVALPLFLAGNFFWTKQKISGDLLLLWVGQNLLNVSVYARDATTMQLELLGGEGAIHDWNYLFGALGVLPYTQAIATTIWSMGFLTIIIGTGLAFLHSWNFKK